MRTAFALALALAATATLAPGRASAGLYLFSYTESDGGVLTGTITGTVDPGNSDIVTVTAVTGVAFNGVTAAVQPTVVVSVTDIVKGTGAPPVVSFSGTTMDLYAVDPTGRHGFSFIPAGLLGANPLIFGGSTPDYASANVSQTYSAANWSLTPQSAAVPEPATVGMMLLGCGSAAGVVRRFRRRAA